jgi:nicotinamidase-related amidase
MKFVLPVRYYCGVPSAQPRGLVTETWELEAERTALVALHCWNVGVPGGPPVPEAFWVFMGSPQNHDRALGIVTQVIAPLLDIARHARLPVIHVQPESVAARYPEIWVDPTPLPPPRHGEGELPVSDRSPLSAAGRRAPTRFGAGGLSAPAWGARGVGSSRSPGGPSRRANAVHGEGYMQWEGWKHLDVAAPVRPRAGDVQVATTEGFDRWLQERGITTLLYSGFATNLCILESPAAMKPMRDRGYRCVILREATMAVEFPDTLERLLQTRAALQYIEAWVGYSASVEELEGALRTEASVARR